MGPTKTRSSGTRRQARRRAPRRRRCLLRDCEQWFRPVDHGERFCSEACRAGWRAWRQWSAQQKYRRQPKGRSSRRAQSKRYRERVRCRVEATESIADRDAREGHPPRGAAAGETCSRPGCYERFQLTRRSPEQKFCSPSCRRALWRVWERERRWLERGEGRRGASLRWWEQMGSVELDTQ